MAFCRNCGKPLNDNAAFCTNCGAPVDGAQQAEQSRQTQQSDASDNFFRRLLDTPNYTASMQREDISANRAMGILSYIGLLVLAPIFAAKQSKFARFHANQGLLLLIGDGAVTVTAWLVGYLPYFLRWPLQLAVNLAWIPLTFLMVVGIVNAARGLAKELPVVGKLRILK